MRWDEVPAAERRRRRAGLVLALALAFGITFGAIALITDRPGPTFALLGIALLTGLLQSLIRLALRRRRWPQPPMRRTGRRPRP
jgi:hypothetical protein